MKGTTIYPESIESKEGKDKVDLEASYLKGLLWKSHKTVSFAYNAPWVVGRFCYSERDIL